MNRNVSAIIIILLCGIFSFPFGSCIKRQDIVHPEYFKNTNYEVFNQTSCNSNFFKVCYWDMSDSTLHYKYVPIQQKKQLDEILKTRIK